jgi:hypothetical protein
MTKKETLQNIRKEAVEELKYLNSTNVDTDSYSYEFSKWTIDEVDLLLTRLEENSEDNFNKSFIIFFRRDIVHSLERRTGVKEDAQYSVCKEMLMTHYEDSWLFRLFD